MPQDSRKIFGLSTMALPAAKGVLEAQIEADMLNLEYQRERPALRGLGK